MWILMLLTACSPRTFTEVYGGGTVTATFGPEGNLDGTDEVEGASLYCLETGGCTQPRLEAFHDGGKGAEILRWFASGTLSFADAERVLPCQSESDTYIVLAATEDGTTLSVRDDGAVAYEATLDLDALDNSAPQLSGSVSAEMEASLVDGNTCSNLPTGKAGLSLTFSWSFDGGTFVEERREVSPRLVSADDYL